MIINDDGTEEPKGKTYPKLIKVADSQDANSLLIAIGKFNEAGSRTREENVQRIAAFLRWATSKESEYLLDEELSTCSNNGNYSL